MPAILATQVVKAGESLEPGRQRLQCAEIMPLHSSLGKKEQNSMLKKEDQSGQDGETPSLLKIQKFVE